MLATLRRLRRIIASVVSPALFLSLLAGAACPGMSAAAPIPTHSAHHPPAALAQGHASHEHHTHEGASVPALPAGDCPHCLGGHASGNVTPFDCDVVASAGPTTTHALATGTPAPPVATWDVSTASAVPPLIRRAARATSTPGPSVPLHIRYCALLI